MAAGSSTAQRRSYSWHRSLSFNWELWEHLSHAWAGIKGVGSHIFVPQRKEANFCPTSWSSKNLSLAHHSLSCPQWQPEVGLFPSHGHPSLTTTYPAGSLRRLCAHFSLLLYLHQWRLRWFFLLLVSFQHLQFGWNQFLQRTKKCLCNSCISYSST